MKAMVAAASTGILLAAFGSASHAAGGSSGLYGVATRSPVTPVCRSEQPCGAPAKNIVLLFTHSGHIVGRARTDRLGRYRVRLPSSVYGVRLTTSAVPRVRLSPRRVRVPAHRVARIDFTIDTGLR